MERGGGRRPSPFASSLTGGPLYRSAMGQAPAVGTDVLPLAEAEPLISANTHRHVERTEKFKLHDETSFPGAVAPCLEGRPWEGSRISS